MHGERGIVLDDHMDITEMPLQRVAAVDRVRSRGMEHQIDCSNGFVHSVGDGEPGFRDGETWIRSAIPDGADRVEHEGAGGAQNGFGFRNA